MKEALSVLDLAALEAYQGNGQAPELVEAFLTSSPPLLERLAQACQDGDRRMIYRFCHTLLGAATTVGAHAMITLCQQLMDAPDRSQWGALVEQLKTAFTQTQEALIHLARDWKPVTETPVTEPGPQQTLLVVEDHDASRKAIELALAAHYQLIMTDRSDGVRALCERERPAAALIDLNLGFSETSGGSGSALIPQLKDQLPVIILTVDATPASLVAATQAGAWLYVVKSPTPFQLRAHVACAIARYQASYTPPESPNAVDLATGWFMATYHLSFSAARQMMKTLASTQRCRLSEIAEQTLERHTVEMTTRELAKRLFYTSDSSPP